MAVMLYPMSKKEIVMRIKNTVRKLKESHDVHFLKGYVFGYTDCGILDFEDYQEIRKFIDKECKVPKMKRDDYLVWQSDNAK